MIREGPASPHILGDVPVRPAPGMMASVVFWKRAGFRQDLDLHESVEAPIRCLAFQDAALNCSNWQGARNASEGETASASRL